MKLEEAKKLFQGEWIAFRTLEEGDNPEGEVVLHHKDRRTLLPLPGTNWCCQIANIVLMW